MISGWRVIQDARAVVPHKRWVRVRRSWRERLFGRRSRIWVKYRPTRVFGVVPGMFLVGDVLVIHPARMVELLSKMEELSVPMHDFGVGLVERYADGIEKQEK